MCVQYEGCTLNKFAYNKFAYVVSGVILIAAVYYFNVEFSSGEEDWNQSSSYADESGFSQDQGLFAWRKVPFGRELCVSDCGPREKKPEVNHYPIPKRIDIGHIEGKGVGYDRGYTHFTTIIGPEYQLGKFLPLVSLGAAVFDDGKWFAEAGFIGRYLPKSMCEVFGFNLFYDFRQGRWGNFNQVGGGLEVLNKRWELHTNAGFSVGTNKHSKRRVFHYIGPFEIENKETQFSARFSFDFKAGYYVVNSRNFQLYAQAGPYYFSMPFGEHAWGGQAMLRPQYKDYLFVELSVSSDRVFDTNYQVNVILSLPLYHYSKALKNKRGPCGMSNRQIYQPVDPMIKLDKKCCWDFD